MFNFRVLIGRPSNELRCIGRRPFDVLTSVHVARTQVTTRRCSAWPATACWRVSLAWRPAAAWSKSFPPSLGCSSAHHYHGQWLSQAISRLRRFAKWMRGGAEGWGLCVRHEIHFLIKKKKNKIFFSKHDSDTLTKADTPRVPKANIFYWEISLIENVTTERKWHLIKKTKKNKNIQSLLFHHFSNSRNSFCWIWKYPSRVGVSSPVFGVSPWTFSHSKWWTQ